MSATVTVLIPPHAVTCWTDSTDVFVMLPTKGPVPYIARYPKTEAGLAKALALMTKQQKSLAPQHRTLDSAKDQPTIIKRVEPFSDRQRQAARELIKKLKIT